MGKNKYLSYDFTLSELGYMDLKLLLFNYWQNIAINQFDYKNIEKVSKGLTSEILEKQLFNNGMSVFFKDANRGYFALKPVSNGNINVYGENLDFTPYGFGESFKTVRIGENAVLIKNNALKMPTAELLNYYCGELADIEFTKKMNRDAIKMPYIFNTDEKTVLSAKNIFKKIHANEPAIFKNILKGDDIGVEVLQTGAQFYGAELDDQYNNYEAKILTLLGLDNFVEDKKERVQAAEVESQDEYIISSFRASLESREKAIDEINKMFGLDLSVEYVTGKQIEPTDTVDEEDEPNE